MSGPLYFACLSLSTSWVSVNLTFRARAVLTIVLTIIVGLL